MTPEQIFLDLSPFERQNLVRLTYGDHNPSWSVFLLIWKGLATFKKKWLIFGEKEVKITRKGWAVIKLIEKED